MKDYTVSVSQDTIFELREQSAIIRKQILEAHKKINSILDDIESTRNESDKSKIFDLTSDICCELDEYKVLIDSITFCQISRLSDLLGDTYNFNKEVTR